jgi:hypothetical protein
LILAAAAHINNEDTSITRNFNEKELALVENFEKFNIFGDVLSPEDMVDRIARREDIYELINEIYRGQYSDLDRLLDDPKIERDLKYAFKFYYEKRLNKIKKGVQAYVDKYGPIVMVSQIEHKVWDKIKQSEKEREQIAETLRKQIAELAYKVKELDKIDSEGEAFENKLREYENRAFTEESALNLHNLQSEKDRLSSNYSGLERDITGLIEATTKKQQELAVRQAELEKSRQEYKQQMQEEKERIVESELKQIDALKSDLASEARSLFEEKTSLQIKRQEMDDRLKQLTEAVEGKSLRFIAKEDAKLCELNFIARFDTKMHDFPLKVHSPIEGKTYEITSWNESSHLRFADGNTPDSPTNARSRYILSEKKHGFFGEKIKKVIIEAVSLNHLREFEGYGFDARRANLSELLTLLSKFINSAEIGKYLHVIGIASPTGWDEGVIKEITSAEFAHNYVSRSVSICLLDALTGEVYYNPLDKRISDFVEKFRPELQVEHDAKINKAIKEELKLKGFVSFADFVNSSGEPRTLILKIFYELEKEANYGVRMLKNIGLILENKK